jgi:hypothetical protein
MRNEIIELRHSLLIFFQFLTDLQMLLNLRVSVLFKFFSKIHHKIQVSITKPGHRYCYVINYAPETGQPCYRLQLRNVQGYNEQVVASTRFTMRTTRNADRS